MLWGTITWNSMSTLPCLSATFLKRAVTTAASSTSCATISPSSSLMAFMIRISLSPSMTVKVSLLAVMSLRMSGMKSCSCARASVALAAFR